MTIKELKEYLSNVDASIEEKNIVMDFKQKEDYLDNLYKSRGVQISSGTGDPNANVMFIFPNMETFKKCRQGLNTILQKIGAEMWQFYITFLDKGIGVDLQMLKCEISAVFPKSIYLFNDKPLDDEEIKGSITYIIEPSYLMTGSEGLNKAWKQLKFLINKKKEVKRNG